MREELATVVHEVLAKGLDLRDRLLRGEDPNLALEQGKLQAALLSEREAHRFPEYGGDERAVSVIPSADRDDPTSGVFLGARYALTCWLDELFVLDSPWQQVWNEHKMEVQLYSGNDRAWRFWEQARLASSRGNLDALEVFYLCVMLGFSGELLENPSRLAEWINNTRTTLNQGLETTWRPPAGLDPPTRVPPLRGRASLQQMLLIACGVLLALVPVIAVVLARRMT